MIQKMEQNITEKDLKNLNAFFKDYNDNIELAQNYMEFWQNSFQKFMTFKKAPLEDIGLVKMVYGKIDTDYEDYKDDHVFIYSCTAAYLSNLITGGGHTRKESFRNMIKGYIKQHLSREKKAIDPDKYETFRKINEDKRFMKMVDDIEKIIEANIS